MQLYLRLLNFAKPYIIHMVMSLVCMLILSATSAGVAYLVKPAIDDVFLAGNFKMLVVIPVLLIAAYLAKGLADYGQSYFMGYAGNRAVTDIRDAVYRHIQRQSLAYFTKVSTGELMSRIANDVALLRRSVSDSVKKILRNFFMVIGLTAVAVYQNWQLALCCFVLLPVAALIIVKFGRRAKKYSRRTQERLGRISTFLDETISGNQTVKSFCMEDYEKDRFASETDRLFRVGVQSLMVAALASPVMEILGALMGGAIIYAGGYQVIVARSMTTGEFFSFVAAMAMLYRPIKALNRENVKVQQGLAAAVRVFEVLDMVPEIQDKPGAVELAPMSSSVEFREVSFRYDEKPVLQEVSFRVNYGETIAIVGHSGAGKTTIANLILRFYDVCSGGIFIDGRDIRDVTLRSLRGQIAFVTQEAILFNDTVRNNIAYGSPDISEETIVQAAEAAKAHEFITAMHRGYDTVIGEKGVKLSGGQQQRLAIARAIAKQAPILVLDEATSALDTRSEQAVQQALENLMQGRTTFVIAHRLATVRRADQILVMADGRVIERGSHEDLIQHRGVYNQLIEIQSGYHKQAPDTA